MQTRGLAASFDTSTRSVTRTGVEKFTRKVTCVSVLFFFENPFFRPDAKVLRIAQNVEVWFEKHPLKLFQYSSVFFDHHFELNSDLKAIVEMIWRFQLFSSLLFVLLVNRCACGHPHSFRFYAGSEFGSGRPDESISVRWRWISLTHVMVKGRKVPGNCKIKKKAETHSVHASTVLLAIYKKRSSSCP